MSDTVLVNPRLYNQDLHDAYSGFMGYFGRKGIPWYTQSYSSFFSSFDAFLAFGWGCVVVVDVRSGKGHVCIRTEGNNVNGNTGPVGVGGAQVAGGSGKEGGTLQQFARMIKTRFGESLPKLTNQLPVQPAESNPRQIRLVSDINSYKRLAATIPSAETNLKKKRLRSGDVSAVRAAWEGRQHNFLSIELTWWEKGNGVVLEAGVCACRARNIHVMGAWPPNPEENYRRAHYVVSEWLDKRTNTNHHMPSHPRNYAHGPSQSVSMTSLERVLNATISGLAEPEAEGLNPLVILTIGDSSRLGELKNVHIPSNVTFIDVSNFERSIQRNLLASKGQHQDINGLAHLNLRGIVSSLGIPIPPHISIHNSGNAAFYMMLAFQKLVDRDCLVPYVLQAPIQPYPYPQMQIYPPAPPIMPAAMPVHNQPSSPRRVASRQQSIQIDLGNIPAQMEGAHDRQPRSKTEEGPAMRRSTTMYWDEAPTTAGALLGHGMRHHSHEHSSGSDSGSGRTRGKPDIQEIDRGRQVEKVEETKTIPASNSNGTITHSISKMRLNPGTKTVSDEIVPKSGPRFFLGSIGRKGSGA